jgi:hypothetical protein
MGHESSESTPIQPEPPALDFGRFHAVCFDNSEGGISEKELTEVEGIFYDDDGSTYEEMEGKKGVFKLKKFIRPGYKDMYERLKLAHPTEREGFLDYWANRRLDDQRRAADRAAGIIPEKKKRKGRRSR